MSKSGFSVCLDAIIFIVICCLLHWGEVCWLGFCHVHRSYQRHHAHRTSLASYLFFIIIGYVASLFTWWPEKLGNPPKGLINVIYKVWLAVLVYNFSERLMWYALYESASLLLEFTAFVLTWLANFFNCVSCKECFEVLKGDCIHQLALILILLYGLYKTANCPGFSIIKLIKECTKRKCCNDDNEGRGTNNTSCSSNKNEKDDNNCSCYL